MRTPLSEALSPQIQAQLPPHIRSLEDLALTSSRDIAARKGWEWVFAKAIDPARRPVHILLVGPPASTKSLFLLQVGKLPGAYLVLGGTASKAGLAEVLIEEQPSSLLIDELDKMDREDLSVLLSLCETGTVSVTKYQRRQRVDLPTTRVFAASNSDGRIPREVLSRFLRFRLRAYTRDEFIEVVTKMLPATEGVSQDLASHIAERLAERLKSADVRDAVRLARLAHSKDEVDRLLATMARYS